MGGKTKGVTKKNPRWIKSVCRRTETMMLSSGHDQPGTEAKPGGSYWSEKVSGSKSRGKGSLQLSRDKTSIKPRGRRKGKKTLCSEKRTKKSRWPKAYAQEQENRRRSTSIPLQGTIGLIRAKGEEGKRERPRGGKNGVKIPRKLFEKYRV